MGALALHAGGGIFFGLAWLLLFAAVAVFIVYRARRWRGRGGPGSGAAEAVLAERFARGDIDEEQYRRTRAVLKQQDQEDQEQRS
jgi:putative membrane protein